MTPGRVRINPSQACSRPPPAPHVRVALLSAQSVSSGVAHGVDTVYVHARAHVARLIRPLNRLFT